MRIKSKKSKLKQPLINIEKTIDNSITFITGDTLLSMQYDLIKNLSSTKKEIDKIKKLLKMQEVE